MRRKKLRILIFILFTILSIQAFRLQNIEYELPAILCEDRSEIKFRVLDKVTLENEKTNIILPPGNWVYFFSEPFDVGAFYKVEIMGGKEKAYSQTFLINLYSKFDLRELKSQNNQYCISNTVDNNLVSIGHYYEIKLI